MKHKQLAHCTFKGLVPSVLSDGDVSVEERIVVGDAPTRVGQPIDVKRDVIVVAVWRKNQRNVIPAPKFQV